MLEQLIRQVICERGGIPFAEFMELALYHPEHGYYSSGKVRLGRCGDFFTSVSVGPLFGALLARQLAEMWHVLGKPEPFRIVEQGAHHGDLADDILRALEQIDPSCYATSRYCIAEPFGALQQQQVERLARHRERVRWVAALEDLGELTGVHLSNELVDAFPVHLVRWSGATWSERHVRVDRGELVLVDAELSNPELVSRLKTLVPAELAVHLPPGFTTEVNLAALRWVDALSGMLKRGFVLVADYGFSRFEYFARTSGTLAACRMHRRERNPLTSPGLLDLSAHVDFTSLAERAMERSLNVFGYVEQHRFITRLGQAYFAEDRHLGAARDREVRAFRTLADPQMLGHVFKILCLAKEVQCVSPLAGFQSGGDPLTALGLR